MSPLGNDPRMATCPTETRMEGIVREGTAARQAQKRVVLGAVPHRPGMLEGHGVEVNAEAERRPFAAVVVAG